jgi:hypothetical protein
MAALALALAAAAALAFTAQRHAPPAERPQLALLTSLPLLVGEQFGLEPPRSPAVARIRREFQLAPIAVADRASLAQQSMLLIAHPRAQPAEALVDLDRWVRDGGRVVLLADPLLRWESSRPLGDRLRPPPDFADTGLLAHWGLRLGIDEAGEGSLRAAGGQCAVRDGGLVARCRVGRGRATVIADADFLMGHGADATARLDLMIRELRALGPR